MALLPEEEGEPYRFTSVVRPSESNRTLIDHLAGRFSYHGRTDWEHRLREGRVEIEGRICLDPLYRVRQGEVVAYDHGCYKEPDIPTNWACVAHGGRWLAVDKPSGMPVQSTGRIFRQTLVWQVRRLMGRNLSPVHRLDQDTSGLVVFAADPEAASILGQDLSNRRICKSYVARLTGVVDRDMECLLPLIEAHDPDFPSRVRPDPLGKPCRTLFCPVFPDGQGGTWCLVHPCEGRRHQIRAHAEALEHPLADDALYDGKCGKSFLDWIDAGSPSPRPRFDLHLLRWDLPQSTCAILGLPLRLSTCLRRIPSISGRLASLLQHD